MTAPPTWPAGLSELLAERPELAGIGVSDAADVLCGAA